jgi:hypothetical protein
VYRAKLTELSGFWIEAGLDFEKAKLRYYPSDQCPRQEEGDLENA